MAVNRVVVEFIGTFFLVLTIGLVVLEPGSAPAGLAPLAISAALMVMVFAGGHLSGAHYNPAVSVAVFLRGRVSLSDLIAYIVAQIAAALGASLSVLFIKGAPSTTLLSPDPIKALLAEFLFTFALAYVVLNVATARGTSGNSFYGLAIGSTVLAGAFAVGPISGGAFNPAVAIALVALGITNIASLWIYLLATLAGGAAAAGVFRLLNRSDEESAEVTSPAGASANAATASASLVSPTPRRRRR